MFKLANRLIIQYQHRQSAWRLAASGISSINHGVQASSGVTLARRRHRAASSSMATIAAAGAARKTRKWRRAASATWRRKILKLGDSISSNVAYSGARHKPRQQQHRS